MIFDDAALSGMLKNERDAMAALAVILREEQRTLVRGELEQLPAFAESKAARILELTRIGSQRVEWQRKVGIGPGKKAMVALLHEHATGAPLSTVAWRKLIEATEDAHRINDVNGTLINARLSATQQAIGILFSAAKLDGAYTPDGRTVCYRPAQRLAIA